MAAPSTSMQVFIRRWHLLAAIPRAPVAIDTATLTEALRAAGLAADPRTVRRDLAQLAEAFPLRKDPRAKRQLWSWDSDAPSWEFPGLDAASALLHSVITAQVRSVLPRGVMAALSPAATRAADALGPDGAWPDRVRVLPWGPPVGPPDISPTVMIPVLLGLHESRVLDVLYPRPEAGDQVRLRARPYGLVVREGRFYLVAGLRGYERPVILVLHRMSQVRVLDEPCPPPEGFDLDTYLQEGAPGFLVDPDTIDLVLRFEPEIGPALVEARVSPDQELTEEQDGTWVLSASVADTSQLRAWLLGYGTFVEVLEPAFLRDWVAEQAVAMSERYM